MWDLPIPRVCPCSVVISVPGQDKKSQGFKREFEAMAAKDKAYLRVLTGAQKGRVYVLSDLTVFDVGRGNGCQVRIEDDGCAFNHARIYRKDSVWTFFDLNTEQGSQVNNIPVERRDLEGGEIILLGNTELHFAFEPPVSKKAATSGASQEAASGPAMPAPAQQTPAAPAVAAAPAAAEPAPPPAPAPLELAIESALESAFAGADGGDDALLPGSLLEETPPRAPVEPTAELGVSSLPTEQTGMRVIVVDGDRRDIGKRIDMVGEGIATLGRALDCEIVLSDAKVSRRHSQLRWSPLGITIADLDSVNGTVVNGEPATETPLRKGDTIRLGFTLLTLEMVAVTNDRSAGAPATESA